MGKSDKFVFDVYRSVLQKKDYDSIAFLGFATENEFTRSIKSDVRHFYDLSLGNWEINSNWSLKQKYELVVSTRCPYFAKDPYTFIEKCKQYTFDCGSILLDWGLGDHWRFEKYKVGWVRDGEHEYAYDKQNYLYSCLWRDSFSMNDEVISFWNSVKGRFGYNINDSINDVVKNEVPSIVDYDFDVIKFKYLWYDYPQLYIVTCTHT